VRYYIVVHSLEPLRLVRHPFFALRVANDQYELNDLENFQKHFTLMSCLEKVNEMKHVALIICTSLYSIMK
jgi:hypothetical protein